MRRRELLASALLSLPVYALLAECASAAERAQGSPRHWIARQQALALALARGELAPAAWQGEVETLFRSVDLDSLLAEIGRAELKTVRPGPTNDPVKRSVHFVDEDGRRRALRYAVALFEFSAENVITPHGHRNMASAHLVVQGGFRVRNFERLHDEPGAVVIRPTLDEEVRIGAVSTMSEAHNNIHWFVPLEAGSTTLDVIVSGLQPGEPPYVIEAVDPVRGTPLGDGSIRAPILDFGESSRFYTAAI